MENTQKQTCENSENGKNRLFSPLTRPYRCAMISKRSAPLKQNQYRGVEQLAARWVSEGSAASGRCSDPSAVQRSIKSRKSVSPKILSGTANRGQLQRITTHPVRRTKSPVTVQIIQYRGVEQLAARRAHNPEVVGSSPASATIKVPKTTRFSELFFYFAAKKLG